MQTRICLSLTSSSNSTSSSMRDCCSPTKEKSRQNSYINTSKSHPYSFHRLQIPPSAGFKWRLRPPSSMNNHGWEQDSWTRFRRCSRYTKVRVSGRGRDTRCFVNVSVATSSRWITKPSETSSSRSTSTTSKLSFTRSMILRCWQKSNKEKLRALS